MNESLIINSLINLWPAYSTIVFPTAIQIYIVPRTALFTLEKGGNVSSVVFFEMQNLSVSTKVYIVVLKCIHAVDLWKSVVTLHRSVVYICHILFI